jgi:hypothetical protein
MSTGHVFKNIVEPSLERIPVLEALHIERHHGREYVVNQTINRNVFTEFDRKLSRHLAATRGAGFPLFTVSVRVSERGGAATPRQLAVAHYASVPHALKGIAERATAHDGRVPLKIQHSAAGGVAAHATREVGADTVDAMEAALGIARHLGEAEFLDMSGDFDIVLAGPPGKLRPMVMHLQNGSVSMPCQTGDTITPFECPIHDFAGHAGGNLHAQGYLASARHALVAAKEAAVAEFRAAAEARILGFDRALAGRPLAGHRLDAAVSLIERLKAGLGDTLSGLAEDAMITALDWSAEIAGGGAQRSRGGSQVILAHPAAGAL